MSYDNYLSRPYDEDAYGPHPSDRGGNQIERMPVCFLCHKEELSDAVSAEGHIWCQACWTVRERELCQQALELKLMNLMHASVNQILTGQDGPLGVKR